MQNTFGWKKDLDKRERSLNTDNERYTNTSTIRVIIMLSKIENNNALCRLKTKKGYPQYIASEQKGRTG